MTIQTNWKLYALISYVLMVTGKRISIWYWVFLSSHGSINKSIVSKNFILNKTNDNIFIFLVCNFILFPFLGKADEI